jgi:outer membrane protein assembly factor BamB
VSDAAAHTWPQLGGNAAHTGLAADNTPKPPLRLAWAGEGNHYLFDSPLVANDRVLIGGRDCTVYCWRATDGAVLWTHQLEPSGEKYKYGVLPNVPTPNGSCIVGKSVLVPAKLGYAQALALDDGDCRWKRQMLKKTTGSFATDGKHVYAGGAGEGADESALVAIDPQTGNVVWSQPTADDLKVCALGKGLGVACDAQGQRRILVFDLKDGSTRWSHEFAERLYPTALIIDDLLVVGGGASGLFVFDLHTGATRWQLGVTDQRLFGPPTSDGKRLFIPHNKLWARDLMTGDLIWASEDPHTMYKAAGPTIVDDYVYIGGGMKSGIDCYRIADGQRVWSYPTGDMVYSTPAVVDGRLFVGCHDGKLYCFEEDPDASA